MEAMKISFWTQSEQRDGLGYPKAMPFNNHGKSLNTAH